MQTIVGGLPEDLGAAVFVVLHTSPDSPGLLDKILRRAGPLSVGYAMDREPIEARRIYLAPAGQHLLLKRDHVRVTNGPRENRFRPAVDPLFRTAAAAHGPRVIGVVLSGGQDDGAVGLAQIKQRGGTAIVQNPDDAVAWGMPRAAIQNVAVDYVLLPGEMPSVIASLVQNRTEMMVALSGYGAASDVAASQTAGFDAHLVKPVDLHELLTLLT